MFSTRVRLAQLVEFGVYAMGVAMCWPEGARTGLALLAIAALFLLARLVFVAASFAIAWVHRSRRPPGQRIGLVRTIAMVLREWRALLTFNLFYVPWDAAFLRRDPPPARDGVAPVVLVHGYFANRGYFLPLVRRLERAGVRHVSTPNLRSWLASIERFEQELGEAVDRLARDAGRPVILVAHSMGGLAARAYLARRGTANVTRLVTLGSPHRGTRLAPFGVGENARQMRRGSEWLARLETQEGGGPPIEALSIFSWHDNMVAPQEASRLAWAREATVAGVGHLALLVDEGVFELVLRELRAGGAVPG
jgi:pimeloyl-ACP methyl ester carboxylesterase